MFEIKPYDFLQLINFESSRTTENLCIFFEQLWSKLKSFSFKAYALKTEIWENILTTLVLAHSRQVGWEFWSFGVFHLQSV